MKLKAEARRTEAASNKAEKAEILFAQKAEYHGLRSHLLRIRSKRQTSTDTKPAHVSEIGFVSQPAVQPIQSTPTVGKIQTQEAAA